MELASDLVYVNSLCCHDNICFRYRVEPHTWDHPWDWRSVFIPKFSCMWKYCAGVVCSPTIKSVQNTCIDIISIHRSGEPHIMPRSKLLVHACFHRTLIHFAVCQKSTQLFVWPRKQTVDGLSMTSLLYCIDSIELRSPYEYRWTTDCHFVLSVLLQYTNLKHRKISRQPGEESRRQRAFGPELPRGVWGHAHPPPPPGNF